ncbi:MAG: hypothetical protein HF978_13685 [Desulfobacteraceae bacterium]|nr:hypothetical protein [Desulfobacteraceae bacterium]MBC2756594.1 hypothetical protein [Desulfobacteraceae bacterium]
MNRLIADAEAPELLTDQEQLYDLEDETRMAQRNSVCSQKVRAPHIL